MYGIEEDELEDQFEETSREEAEIDENDAWLAPRLRFCAVLSA